MGRIIRRTVTITITETVTITWATGDDHAVGAKRHPLSHSSTVVPDTPKPKEEADELFHGTLSDTQISDPAATTPTPAAVSAAQADDVTAKPAASRPRQRKRRRRTAGDQGST